MISFIEGERPRVEEYVEFLSRTDLGSEYPRKEFLPRLRTLLEGADVSVTARDEDGLLVGVCLGLTDFAYFLFLTDLGVDRRLVRQGIGRELVRRALEAAGGPDDICAVTWANPEALPFYDACGWRPKPALVARGADDWDFFTVTDPEAVLREGT